MLLLRVMPTLRGTNMNGPKVPRARLQPSRLVAPKTLLIVRTMSVSVHRISLIIDLPCLHRSKQVPWGAKSSSPPAATWQRMPTVARRPLDPFHITQGHIEFHNSYV